MKVMNWKIVSGITLLVLVLFCFGLNNGYTQSSPKRGGMLTVGLNTDMVGVDPHTHPALLNSFALHQVFEPLVAYGEKLDIVPVLAARWEISPDLKTYTFYLNEGKLFHNGREMIASDVKYSIERIMDPKTKDIGLKDFANIKNIEVVNKYVVRFHLEKADALLLDVLARLTPIRAIVPREEVEKQGGVMKHPVGTGPYKFVEWKPDRYLLLERFDQYKAQPGPIDGFGGERIAYIDKIKFVPIREESVATMALLNKEIDFLQYLPYKDVEKFKSDYAKRGIVLAESAGLSTYGIFFGCDKSITKEVKFRQACAYAIDREIVSKAATRGYCTINSSFIASTHQILTNTWQAEYCFGHYCTTE